MNFTLCGLSDLASIPGDIAYLMELVIIGDIICDVVAVSVVNLPQWNTDTLANGGISTMAGGTGLNNAVHASNYIKWLQKYDNYHNDIKIHIFSSTCDDVNGRICQLKLRECEPILVNHSISPPIEPSPANKQMNIPMINRTSTCIVISGPKDRCFITDRGCISNLAVDWFCPGDILGFDELLPWSPPTHSSVVKKVNDSADAEEAGSSHEPLLLAVSTRRHNYTNASFDPLYCEGKRHIHIAGYYNCNTLPIRLPEFLRQVCTYAYISISVYSVFMYVPLFSTISIV